MSAQQLPAPNGRPLRFVHCNVALTEYVAARVSLMAPGALLITDLVSK
jgi:hypothetical protein